MKRYQILLSCSAIVVAGATAASADCASQMAALTGASGAISQDGSHAPLQSGTEAAAPLAEKAPSAGGESADTAAETGDGIAKDGSHVPLDSGEAGADVAMSAQDAQAQSEGGETATAEAGGATGGQTGEAGREDAMARAQAALDQGDEEGCLAAVKQARES